MLMGPPTISRFGPPGALGEDAGGARRGEAIPQGALQDTQTQEDTARRRADGGGEDVSESPGQSQEAGTLVPD